MKNKFYVVELREGCFLLNCNIFRWVDGLAVMEIFSCDDKEDALHFTKKYIAEAIARNMGGKVIEHNVLAEELCNID